MSGVILRSKDPVWQEQMLEGCLTAAEFDRREAFYESLPFTDQPEGLFFLCEISTDDGPRLIVSDTRVGDVWEEFDDPQDAKAFGQTLAIPFQNQAA